MSMYKEQGYNRLAKLITIVAFILTYTTICIVAGVPDNLGVVFIVFPIVSLLASAGAFIFTRLVYWVIDGFKNPKDQNV